MAMTGKCLCGAVRYSVEAETKDVGACHCGMCRAWSGGVFIGLEASAEDATFEGAENLSHYRSSDWAERAFCKTCGASVYYRVTAPGPAQGTYHIGAGTLDDYQDMALTAEIFIDKKPGAYAFAGETHKTTEAEVMALYAPPGTGA